MTTEEAELAWAIENYLHWKANPREFVAEPILLLVESSMKWMKSVGSPRLLEVKRDFPLELLEKMERDLE